MNTVDSVEINVNDSESEEFPEPEQDIHSPLWLKQNIQQEL